MAGLPEQAFVDVDPEAMAFLSGSQRKRAQAGINALIDYLDAIMPDADLEPSLGSCNPTPPCRGLSHLSRAPQCWPMADHLAFAHGGSADLEEVDEDGDPLDDGEEDTSDHEPSLGAPEPHMPYHRPAWAMSTPIGDQRCWAGGGDEDRERDTSDYEAALGVPEGSPDLPGHWGQNSRSAFEDENEGWDIDWENEEDERSGPGYREGMRLVALAT